MPNPPLDLSELRRLHEAATRPRAVNDEMLDIERANARDRLMRWDEWLPALLSRIEALEEENGRLRGESGEIKRHSWCWIPGDDNSYDYPLEWAEYDLDPKVSPIVQEFAWAGRLPSTWAVFTWAGNEDDGEWNVVEYESEADALAALPSAPTNGGER